MANITTQTIRVDLSTDKVIPSAFTHQNDTARTLEFSIYNKGVPYTMTGNTVKFAYKSPIVDGAYTVITGSGMASGTVSGNNVTVTLPSAYTAISGVGMLTMIITPTSGTVRPVNIRLVVQKSADGSDVMAGASDFPDAWMDEKVYSWLDDHIDGIFTEEQFADSVDTWLDDHPEATTTVQDGAITYAKLNALLKGSAYQTPYTNASGDGIAWHTPFVTPEMYGAVGDGVTDDTSAWQAALNHGGLILCNSTSNYLITSVLRVKANTTIEMNGCTVTCNQKRWLFNFLNTDEFTEYNGNGNIHIKNGNVIGGSVSFWHGENISFERVHFKNCLNDHFFELAASKNVTIEECSFVGMKANSGSVHEYINIDPNGSEATTYFTGTSYPAGNYDSTRNEDIYIRNNYFDINEDDANFQAQDNPFGCHSPIGNYHKNVQFVENTCLNFKALALRLPDFEEAIIRNNYFKSALCTGTAIQMSKSSDMTYSNINCIIEDNTIITYKWGIAFDYTKGMICRGNSYENLDYANHSFGTLGIGNEDFAFYDNTKIKNDYPDMLSLDSGDYTSTVKTPFEKLQYTRVGNGMRTVSGNTVTLGKLRWTFFDRIYLQFTNSPKIYEIDAWAGNLFAANSNYPIIQDQTTGQSLAYITIDVNSPKTLTVTFESGVTARTVQTVYVEKTIGTRPTT